MITILIALAYIAGLLLCYAMLRIEQAAENSTYTKGARALSWVLSLLSWLMIIILIVGAWVDKISATGYWKRPVKEDAALAETIKPTAE